SFPYTRAFLCSEGPGLHLLGSRVPIPPTAAAVLAGRLSARAAGDLVEWAPGSTAEAQFDIVLRREMSLERMIGSVPGTGALGSLANHARERRHGDAAYFVWNTHINHTNVCAATCDFCAFAAKKDEPRAYTMALDDIFATVGGLAPQVREVHIVGGLHPDLPWSYFTDMMRGIKRVRPDIHVKA